MDIREISAILSSSMYKTTAIQQVETVTDSSEESSNITTVGASTNADSYVSTILSSMDAISSGTYNKMLQEVNVYGGIDLEDTKATSGSGSGSEIGSDTTSSEDVVTTEIIFGSDGSIYLQTTTTTAEGEATVETKKVAGPNETSSEDKPEFNLEINPENKPDFELEFNPEIKPDFKPDNKPDFKPDLKPDDIMEEVDVTIESENTNSSIL